MTTDGCVFSKNPKLLEPVAQTIGSEETRSQSLKLDDDGLVESTTVAQLSTGHRDAGVEVGYIILQPLFYGESKAHWVHNIVNMRPFLSFSSLKIKGGCLSEQYFGLEQSQAGSFCETTRGQHRI